MRYRCPAWLVCSEVGCDKEWGHRGQHYHDGQEDMPLGGTVQWSEPVPAQPTESEETDA